MKKQSKKQSKNVFIKVNRPRLTKKKLIGRGNPNDIPINPNDTPINPDYTTFTDLVDFFEIKDTEYFKNALHDAIGLYSLLGWKGPEYNTYESNKNNIKPITIIHSKNKTFKAAFLKESIQKATTTNTEYKYKGTFIKHVEFIENPGIELIISCAIFEKKDTKEYVVMFIWGRRPNFHDVGYKTVLDKMYKYIIDKTVEASHILLFGFSMGGNLAQHMALRFISQNPEKNIYVATLGSGGTLYEAEKTLFECKLNGKFISMALFMSSEELVADSYGYFSYFDLLKKMKDRLTYIDYSIFPSILPIDSAESLRTVKTMLLCVSYEYNPGEALNTDKYNDIYKIYENYDFHKIRHIQFFDDRWTEEFGRPFHQFVLYRKYLSMLIAERQHESILSKGDLLQPQ